jgi:hypothetical protein
MRIAIKSPVEGHRMLMLPAPHEAALSRIAPPETHPSVIAVAAKCRRESELLGS